MDKVKDEEIPFNILSQQKTKTYNFNQGDILEFGFNSTTIILQDADTENLGDTYIVEGAPNANFGSSSNLFLRGSTGEVIHGLIMFDISSIPTGSNITNSQLSLYLNFNGLDSGESLDITSHRILNQSWNENTMTWNIFQTSITYNTTSSDLINFDDISSIDIWYSWNVTIPTSEDVLEENNNFSIYLNTTLNSGSPSIFDDIRFNTKEDSNVSTRPYLNITYVAPPCSPSLVNSSWSSWTNESCLVTDLMNESRFLTQYDENVCGGANETFFEYKAEVFCDFCTPSIISTDWGAWSNLSCTSGDLMNQTSNKTNYDENFCGEVSNTTSFRFQLDGFCY